MDSPLPALGPRTSAGRLAAAWPVAAGVVAAFALIAWEVAGPTLPIPFELGMAARAPGTPAWALRIPMAAAALAGMLALYIFMARTMDRAAATYAVAVLATAPAWFVHGRTMTGAIVPIACSALVLGGLGVAVLDDTASGRRRWLAVGVATVAAATSILAVRWGAPDRGLASVIAVPAMAVGAAGVLWRRTRASELVLAVGVVLVATGAALALLGGDSSLTGVVLGARGSAAGKATFEAPVAAIAYGLVPWTPLVPIALARRPTSAGHLALLIAAVLAIAAHAALGPRTGPAPVVGIAALAGAVAAMLRSLESSRRPAVALVATVIAIGWLVAHDVRLAPDRALVAFGASDVAIPGAHAAASSLAIRSSIWLCTALVSVALVVPRSWLPTGRGLAMVAAGVFAGLVLRAHAYPELLARLSPGAAFDAWAKSHRAGEPLGLVGVDPRAVVFAPGTAVVPQPDAPGAGRWLAAATRGVEGEPRRFLALGAPELPRVNAEYRAAHGRNVPVLAGSNGAILLATSALARGERSDNPLDTIVLDEMPPALRPMGTVLDDRLEAAGWLLVDEKGRPLDAIARGSKTAHVRIAIRALRGVESGAYCTFLHIDHAPSRFSAEHRELPYPMSLWRAGDLIVDDFAVPLPAQFRAGSYRMYWGVGVLPCDDDRRMHVTAGPNDGHDRVPAGTLEVR
jgi:hypothetical protein